MNNTRLDVKAGEDPVLVAWNKKIADDLARGYRNGFEAGQKAMHQLACAELMHKRTAEHLRKERIRRRKAEFAAENNIKAVGDFLGSETWGSIEATPEHYRGDGLVTCSRAMDSCLSQPFKVVPTLKAFYWWACAFKYLWRTWFKGDPDADLGKLIDCAQKCRRELPECNPVAGPLYHKRINWGHREESGDE